MPVFRRFERLPPKDLTFEGPLLDLKEQMDPTNHLVLASDVAAFANHLGGCLVIGATEVEGHVGEYKGIPVSLAEKLETSLSQAIKARCSPQPFHTFERFAAEVAGNVVLAVFVEPYIGGQAIGVAIKGDEQNDRYKGDSFVFPLRTGKDTTYLLPEQLLMFTEPRIRRAFIQLNGIPIGGKVTIQWTWENGIDPRRVHSRQCTMVEVREERNLMVLRKVDEGRGDEDLETFYAIDLVKSVYQTSDEEWFIVVDKLPS